MGTAVIGMTEPTIEMTSIWSGTVPHDMRDPTAGDVAMSRNGSLLTEGLGLFVMEDN